MEGLEIRGQIETNQITAQLRSIKYWETWHHLDFSKKPSANATLNTYKE